ncbi:MAG: hypothetical protein ABSE48_16935 [Verrucomicrobiota bacterium]|jgi:hypothetical protein
MKNASLMMLPEPRRSGQLKARDSGRSLKICIVFDEELSARNAEVLIRHVTSDFGCNTRLLKFDELRSPKVRVTTARSAYDMDILVLAVHDDQMLPAHIQKWLSICMGFRGEHQQGALVALIDKLNESSGPVSELLVYLEAVAKFARLAFFPRYRNYVNAPKPEFSITPRWTGAAQFSLPA